MPNKGLAQKLNISPAALSLILNDKPGISDATRKRFRKQLVSIGYGKMIRKNTPEAGNLCMYYITRPLGERFPKQVLLSFLFLFFPALH